MEISQEVRNFFSDAEAQELINSSNFEEVYKLAFKKFFGSNYHFTGYGRNMLIISELTRVFYSAGINPLLYMDHVPPYFFCEGAMRRFYIPNNIKTIGENAFNGCYRLMHLVIGTGVESIELDAFHGCNKLVQILNLSKLPLAAGSREYGEVAMYAKNVYTVQGGSQLTNTEEGYNFLYDGKSGYLLGREGFPGVNTSEISDSYDLPRSFTVYDGTVIDRYAIWKGAFQGNKNMVTLNIPDSVTAIGNLAFAQCINLKNLTIGKNVESIGLFSFADNPKLSEEVTYGGTMEQWKKLAARSDRGSRILTSHYIKCSDGGLRYYSTGQFEGKWVYARY